MMLKSCHIENFGKLNNLDLVFKEGLNTFCFENGWGKSTLAAFIKAMFYGLSGSRKKKNEDNERKKYRPWQGGVFGGSITFVVRERTYVLSRIFNEKDADVFELRDKFTNALSKDYSENIGTELFGLDADSFIRTIFIGQNDVETYATDDINAGVGRLLDDSEDLKSYEKALKILDERLNYLNPRRVTGVLNKRKSEISEYERKVKDGSGIKDSISAVEKKADEKRILIEDGKRTITRNKDEIRRLTEIRELGTVKKEWNRLLTIEEQKNNNVKRFRSEFKSQVPSIEEIDKKLEQSKELNRKEAERDTYRVDPESRKKMEDSIVSLRKKLSSHLVGIIAGCLLIFSAVLAVLGLIQGKSIFVLTGAGLSAVQIFMIVFVLLKKKELRSSLLYLEKDYKVLMDKEAAFKKLDSECSALGRNIEEFIYACTSEEGMKDFYPVLLKLRDMADDYYDSKENAEEASGVRQEFEEIHRYELTKIKNRRDKMKSQDPCGTDMDEIDPAGCIEGWNKEIDSDGSIERMNKYIDPAGLIERRNKEIESLENEIENGRKSIRAYEDQLKILREQLDEWEDDSDKLRDLKALQADQKQEYDRIAAAKHALETAKANMTSRYVGPILKSFTSYFSMITGKEPSGLHIDSDTKITIEEKGLQRAAELFSTGWRDLLGTALRISLADAMYQDEIPMLIMDDPFVNFDDEKLKKIPDFLSAVSSKYQIIYFSCSKTRI